MAAMRSYFSGLSRSTFLLACSSLFADVSTEMLYPVLPIFLTQELGADAGLVGVVEGVAPAVQNIAQGVSGWASDRFQRRKPLALVGYGLAAIAKPLMGLSTSWVGVLGTRSLDRLGAGTRSAPRDALVAESVDDADRGKAFGLEGFGDNLGACLGPLLAIALRTWFHTALRTMFLLAFVPGALAGLMVVFVREKPGAAVASKTTLSPKLARLPKDYWKALLATALFGIGNSSNAFLILRTKALGASLTTTILIYAAFNFVAALASYPAGHLSDRFGRKGVLQLSFVVFLMVYGGFALTSSLGLIGVLFALYGLHQGAFRSVGKALATDFVPPDLRATGVGWYTATIGVTGLVASVVGGQLWTRIGPPATFAFGAACALLGSIAVMVLVPERRTE
jgi:MFS family permease